MFATARSWLHGLPTAWPPHRPSKRTLLIALVAAGLALSGGATAVAVSGQPVRDASRESIGPAAETAVIRAAIRAEASRLRARYQGDPAGLLASAQAALMAGRNEATIALFLNLGWAGRRSAALERYGALLGSNDSQNRALGAAGVQHYETELRQGLAQDGPTRLITISVQAQRLIAYEHGQVVVDAPVTTGRPSLATDIGAMHVVRKDSPWTMQSPWPKGSPEWYPDTPVRMVLWFTNNGEGLHDASWQPDATLGPGSQNGPYASHGCVHVPLPAVTTLFQWAPIGTPVVVYPGDGSPAANQVAQQTVDASGNPTSGVRGD